MLRLFLLPLAKLRSLVITAAGVAGLIVSAGCTAAPSNEIHLESFTPRLLAAHWIVEQMPGGTVTVEDGKLVIDDAAGCTVWFRNPLRAPVRIQFVATVRAEPRVSDLNCFWMASDPQRGEAGREGVVFGRSGKFEDYDSMRGYYLGCGGNSNTTTRFRRYAGDGTKPLLPEHDLSRSDVLLTADTEYSITIEVQSDGRVRYVRNGSVIIDYVDPQPLTSGHFGFRTVHSRIEVSTFSVTQIQP